MSALALILILFAATASLRLLSDRFAIPLPSLLVLGGLALAVTPGLPAVTLAPDVVFLLFVPPLLYWAALTSSLRDLRRNLPSILMLAVGLVLATMCVVAVTAHALLPALSWPLCFVLGAIVSPPDAVAVTAVTRRLRLPRDLLMILEGESLINDATALVAYQLAVHAVTTGRFSLPSAALRLLLTGAGGIAVGLAAGWCIGVLRSRVRHSRVVENTISLLTPFVAYLPADALGVSGVLSVVATGLYVGRWGPRVVPAETRLQATAMWEMIGFLLEGLIFFFVGLELPQVTQALHAPMLRTLAIDSLLIGAAMIALRIAWVFPGSYLSSAINRWRGQQASARTWRSVLFAGWAGIRGGDSLVIALSLPFIAAGGARLAGREAVIFITFMIILITLVVQGFTLTPAIRWLRLRAGLEQESEEHRARLLALRAAAKALAQAARDPDTDPAAALELQRRVEHRLQRLGQEPQEEEASASEALPSHVQLRLAMIATQRQTIVQLRDRGEIGDDIMRRLEAELDHEEVLLHRRYE